MFSFFDLIIFLAFFREIPAGLEEAAKIDGANDFSIFVRVVIPVSMPVIATIALFHGVYQWNDYFTGMIYINDMDLQPIQTFLYRVVAQSSSNQMMAASPAAINEERNFAVDQAGDDGRHDAADRAGLSVPAEVFREGPHDRLHQRLGGRPDLAPSPERTL